MPNEQLKKKIDELRNRLLGDLTTEELQKMKLQFDLLEQSQRIAGDDHDHDQGNDHDHSHTPQ